MARADVEDRERWEDLVWHSGSRFAFLNGNTKLWRRQIRRNVETQPEVHPAVLLGGTTKDVRKSLLYCIYHMKPALWL